MKKPSETEIVRGTLTWLKLKYPHGVWWRQNTGATVLPANFAKHQKARFLRFGIPGMADIQGVLNGRAIFIECKMPKGKLSAAQGAFQDMVRAAGASYQVTRAVGDLDYVLL